MSAASSPIKIALVVGGVVAVAGLVLFVSMRSALQHASAGPASPTMTASEMADIVKTMRIAPFSGTDHRGQAVDPSVFSGNWTVVSFGFTHCTLACPTLHREIYRMADQLADRGVRFLTFSVDPDHDTVDQMAEHVKSWGVRGDCWTFVSVDKATLAALLDGFEMPGIADDPANPIALPGGGTMSNIQHTTRFFVIGPDSTVRGLWRGSDPEDVNELIRWVMANAR